MSSIEDRKLLWKIHHANADFSMVIDTCRYILEKDVSQDPIYYALVVGIYTIYGRPFTKSFGAGKITEAIIPKKHLHLHRELVKYRHQVYAHSDAIGALASFGNVNQVRFFVDRPDEILPGVIRWRSEKEELRKIIVLCEALKQKCKYWIDKIQNKYFPHIKVARGEYVVDLDPTSSNFLIKVPPIK